MQQWGTPGQVNQGLARKIAPAPYYLRSHAYSVQTYRSGFLDRIGGAIVGGIVFGLIGAALGGPVGSVIGGIIGVIAGALGD